MSHSERPPSSRRRSPLRAVALGAAAAAAALAFAIVAFGRVDRAAPADVIVVLGARAYADGRPSDALRQRVETAAALYRRGFGRRLMLSGGVDPSGVSEPAVMAAVAEEAGVPRAAMLLDETGVNTAATVRSVVQAAHREGWRSSLFVSHDYHLARIAWLASRAGLEATTSPADESRAPLLGKPIFVVRELASWAVMLSGTHPWFELSRPRTRPRRWRARRAATHRKAPSGIRSLPRSRRHEALSGVAARPTRHAALGVAARPPRRARLVRVYVTPGRRRSCRAARARARRGRVRSARRGWPGRAWRRQRRPRARRRRRAGRGRRRQAPPRRTRRASARRLRAPWRGAGGPIDRRPRSSWPGGGLLAC